MKVLVSWNLVNMILKFNIGINVGMIGGNGEEMGKLKMENFRNV